MRTLKTYGIYGMVEKHAILAYKGVRLHVSFTGGSATANGVTPAKYRTSEPFYQAVIENSDEFKGGGIKLLSQVPIKGGNSTATKNNGNENAVKNIAEEKELETVNVSDLEGEGKRYLMETFGVKGGSLRSIKQVIIEAQKHGIRFVLPGQG